MIVLTDSDARSFCLGIAQLIPILMIALFVVDSDKFVKVVENTKSKALEAEQSALAVISEGRDIDQSAAQALITIDGQIASLDSIDRSQASEEVISALDITRNELIESRTNFLSRLDKLSRDTGKLGEGLKRIAQRKDKLDVSLRKVEHTYFYGVTISIVLAIAGVITALLGAIGLVNGKYAIACVADITIVITANLCRYAIERLIPIPSSTRISRFEIIQACWMVVLCAAQLIFAWIVIAIRVHGA